MLFIVLFFIQYYIYDLNSLLFMANKVQKYKKCGKYNNEM